ncbi:hypothetical protein BDZ94DRAFT_421957 [Collybia nuda]|uniref:DUF6534 domain-containing protein n=1 Tax=Collybia nuda TaxID=64659 RepID=A0A9P5XVF0_9AGAR|nr:hypothetical protein BDZ94DRAFT_421957 [Collybia nuda]
MLSFNPGIIGALEIGSLASVLCHGFLVTQVHNYFSSFPDDPRGLRLTVAAIWMGAIAHLICILWGSYILTVVNFGLAPELFGVPNVLIVSAAFGAFVRSTAQSIYTYRMYKYSNSLYIPILCWSISAYEFVAGILLSATAPFGTLRIQMRYLKDWSWLIYTLVVSTAFVDIIIAASLCYYLQKNRRRSLERTIRVINRLVIWTIQTGLFTSVVAVAVMITFAVDKKNFSWFGLLNFLTSMYPVALLALLNGRRELKLDKPISGTRPPAFESQNKALDVPPQIMLKDRPTQVRVTVEHNEFPFYHIIIMKFRQRLLTIGRFTIRTTTATILAEFPT